MQKIVGLFFILASIAVSKISGDGTIGLVLVPLGAVLIASKHKYFQ